MDTVIKEASAKETTDVNQLNMVFNFPVKTYRYVYNQILTF